MATQIIGILIIVLGLAIVIFLGWSFFTSFILKNSQLKRSLNMILFKVNVPKEENQESHEDKKDEKEIIAVMEQFIASFTKMRDASLSSLFLGPPQLTLEIANPHDDESISFFAAVPKRFAASIEKQIYSFFPKANVERAAWDYNIFTPRGKTAASFAKLRRQLFLPIKTYKHLDADPLSSLTNALSNLKKVEEGAALQIVIRAASPKWQREGISIARKMKQGKSLADAKKGIIGELASDLIKPSRHPNDPQSNQNPINQYNYTQQELRQLTPGEEELLKAIEEKALKPAFEVNIRLLASAEDQEKANEILSHLQNSFSQFDTNDMNNFDFHKPLILKDFIYNFSFRNFIKRQTTVLNSEEIVSLFHFPIYSTQTPKISTLKAKAASAPPNLSNEGILLGKNVYRGQETPIYLQRKDRRRHLYTIGQTGTGKSNFLSEMARQDIQSGEGVCVIDPHGDLIEDLLSRVPQERIQDVILFDPADVERPLGLNLLEYDKPEEKTFVINEMINIFDKLYDLRQTGGPMFEQYMRNAMLLVMDHPESGSTLMEISKVLSDPDFRRMKLENCKNQVVVDFWVKEAEKAGGEAALVNLVPYITSKLTTFISNDIMRPIIAQQHSAFNFREAMDSQKIILINLSKGRIGELNANLLGMVIVGKILMSAMGRVDIPEEERKDFYLYIDEFQNFTTDSIASILSEARKYKLNLIIAHQFIQQLEEKIRDAVFGNVGSMAVFRIGAQDAEFVVKQFAPVFSESDLINVDNYNAFIKIMIDGQISLPFSMATYPPSPKDTTLIAATKEYSRKTYGRDRAQVEEELKARAGYLTPGSENPESATPMESDMPPR